jgi:hypothetical protein
MNTEIRSRFEAAAYKNYEAAYMVNALQTTKGVAAKLRKSEFTNRSDKDGSYVNEMCAVLWVGYQLCVTDLADTIQSASLWNQWCEVQGEAEQVLPENYEIVLVSEGPSSDGDGSTTIMLLHYGVPNEPGLVRIEDVGNPDWPDFPMRKYQAAFEAAKRHYAERMS